MKREEMHALTPEQAAAFLKAAADSPHALLFEFALVTRMRPSEYLALPWRVVDRKVGIVTVQRVLVGKGFAEPKTRRSRRTIALPASFVGKLRGHYLASPLKGPDALVFPRRTRPAARRASGSTTFGTLVRCCCSWPASAREW